MNVEVLMKKNILKFVLLFVLLFSITASSFGCGKNVPNENFEGTHDFEIEETDDYVLKDGVTAYKIIIAEEASPAVIFASIELKNLFAEATGIELTVVRDAGITYSDKAKYLSIGKNVFSDSAYLTADKSVLGEDGVRIVTKGKSIFMLGAGGTGNVYSVYELMKQMLNFEFYGNECYSLNKNVRDIKLMNYNITDVPDIANRTFNCAYMGDTVQRGYRYRVKGYTDIFMSAGGSVWHNSFNYVDVENCPAEWISTDSKQLCYTTRGNKERYAEMVQHCSNVIKESLKTSDKNFVTLTIQDGGGCCNCDSCKEAVRQHGSNSAAVILFCNEINKEVRAWFETPEGQPFARDLQIVLFGYGQYVDPPTDGTKCDPGVSVIFCAAIAYYNPNLIRQDNQLAYSRMDAWSKTADKMLIWGYSTNFFYYLIPYHSFNGMQDAYRLYRDKNAVWLFDQSQHNQTGSGTAWNLLKSYLNSKLAWNCDCDYQELVDNFFKNMYGDASGIMQEYFENVKAHLEHCVVDLNMTVNKSIELMNVNYWPKSVLEDWNNYIDDALAAIDFLKVKDPAAYKMLYRNIITERVSNNYLLVSLYQTELSPGELQNMKLQFKDDVAVSKVTILNSNSYSYIADLLVTWGV